MQSDSNGDIRLIERDRYREDQSAFHKSLPQLLPSTRVFHFDYLYSPLERLKLWQEQDEGSIDQITILYAGYRQFESEAIETYGESIGCETTYTHLSNSKDVQQVGIELTKFFDRAEAEAYPTLIFIDSLSVMLQYLSLNDTVHFTRQCITLSECYGIVGRFFFTPSVHSEKTTNTIRALFSE